MQGRRTESSTEDKRGEKQRNRQERSIAQSSSNSRSGGTAPVNSALAPGRVQQDRAMGEREANH